jgi:small subunit ribosomal protein S8
MVNDTVSDFLTKIRNANNAKHHLVEVPLTKMTQSIAKILKEEGFIEDYKVLNSLGNNAIVLSLKYSGKDRKPVINTLDRISKPGLRIYINKKNIPVVLGNLGIAIISTSHGLLTDREAKNLNVGGELLCKIS